MLIRKNYALSAMVLALSSSVVWAETPLVAQRSDVTLSMANQLVQATLAALQRDDNVGPHNTLAAQRKAFTALSTKTATGLLAERSRSNPDAANLNTVAELLLLGGGVPLKVGDQVIGAIGVAGAGGAQFDEGCAQQAISHVLPTLK